MEVALIERNENGISTGDNYFGAQCQSTIESSSSRMVSVSIKFDKNDDKCEFRRQVVHTFFSPETSTFQF